MAISARRDRFEVYVYDPTIQAKRYVGSFSSLGEAQEVERQAKAGEYVRVRKTSVARWTLDSKGEMACRVCGETAHHLHHLVPAAALGTRRADPRTAGIPLCEGCHKGWHHRAIPIFREMLLPEEVAYVAGVMGIAWLDLSYPPRTPGPDEINQALVEEVAALRTENEALRDQLRRAMIHEAA